MTIRLFLAAGMSLVLTTTGAFVPPRHFDLLHPWSSSSSSSLVLIPRFYKDPTAPVDGDDDDRILHPTRMMPAMHHDLELQRRLYRVHGGSGSNNNAMPALRQWHAGWPIAVCRHCHQRFDVHLAKGDTQQQQKPFFLLNKEEESSYEFVFVPSDPTVLHDICPGRDYVASSDNDTVELSILQSFLMQCQPGSSSSQKRGRASDFVPQVSLPYFATASTTSVIDGRVHDNDIYYFEYAQDFARAEATIRLPPSGAVKDASLGDSVLKHKLRTAEHQEMNRNATTTGVQKQLEGLEERLRDGGDLQKDFDEAQQRLHGARVAHYVMSRYSLTQTLNICVGISSDLPKDIQEIVAGTTRNDSFKNYSKEDTIICRSCNAFLYEFGLRVVNIHVFPDTDTLMVNLQVLPP